jgi:beta-N-acetylhexosaminidase
VVHDLLRTELGFTGVVVTDAMNMAPARRWDPGEAAVRALLAGNDVLLMPPDLAAARAGLLGALASGRLPREQLRRSVTRILTLKHRRAATPRPDLSTVGDPANERAAQAVAAAAVTVLAGPCSGPLVTGPVRVTASDGRATQVAWLTEALRAAGVPVVDTGGSRVHLVGYGDARADLAPDAAVVVGMDTPYVLAAARTPVRVATYSSSRVSMRALAAVIAGTAVAPGRSPVAVDGLPRSACDQRP